MVVLVEPADEAASGVPTTGQSMSQTQLVFSLESTLSPKVWPELVRRQRRSCGPIVVPLSSRGRKMTAARQNSPSENPVTSLHDGESPNQSLFGSTPISRFWGSSAATPFSSNVRTTGSTASSRQAERAENRHQRSQRPR